MSTSLTNDTIKALDVRAYRRSVATSTRQEPNIRYGHQPRFDGIGRLAAFPVRIQYLTHCHCEHGTLFVALN
jgi:hypothetical protein